ncbi:MAG: HEAT repeat domain-containing protein [Thermoanaerobaculia bacterium]
MRKQVTAVLTFAVAMQLGASTRLPVPVTPDADAGSGSAAQKKEESLDRRATAAIDAEQWAEAVRLFRQLAATPGPRQDRALYWLAYAQKEGGKAADSLSTVQQLHQKYPSSHWNDEARALELEVRQSAGQSVSPESLGDDSDLKLLAITSLLSADQERAVTLLDKILRAGGSEEIKERALFVLSQSSSPRGQQLIENIARGGAGKELQEQALHLLGTTGSARSRSLLADVYAKSTDSETRQAALQGMMISGDRQAILGVALGDKDPETRSQAVRLLGAMKASAELDRLYASENAVEVKQAVIEGMFIAGQADRLMQIARTDSNPQLRAAAIRSIGTLGTSRSGEILLQLWKSESAMETKEAIITGLFIQGNARALIEIARKEQNKALRRSIVEKLSLMRSPEARAFMQQLLQ